MRAPQNLARAATVTILLPRYWFGGFPGTVPGKSNARNSSHLKMKKNEAAKRSSSPSWPRFLFVVIRRMGRKKDVLAGSGKSCLRRKPTARRGVRTYRVRFSPKADSVFVIPFWSRTPRRKSFVRGKERKLLHEAKQRAIPLANYNLGCPSFDVHQISSQLLPSFQPYFPDVHTPSLFSVCDDPSSHNKREQQQLQTHTQEPEEEEAVGSENVDPAHQPQSGLLISEAADSLLSFLCTEVI